MIDGFSRYISLAAITKQNEETMMKTIRDKLILKFWAPKEYHCDCGKVFELGGMQKLPKETWITVRFSSQYHHNMNRVMKIQFRTMDTSITPHFTKLDEQNGKN